MGQARRRAAGTRSKRAQLGLVAVTVATVLMMAWAIFPATAFASTEVTPWTGNGAPKLPCPGTTHWIFSGWGNDFDEVSNPVLTVNGTNYPMSQQGNGNVFEAFVPGPLAANPSASASWTWDETSDKPTPILTISDCDTDPTTTTPPPTTTTPPPTTTTPPPTTTTPPPTTTTPPPTTTTPPPKGRIEIKKETIPDGDPTQFTFTGAFNITIGDGQGAASNVDPGTYAVSESVPAGWTLTSISCDDDDSSGSGTTATYVVSPGETVKCVFTNTKNPTTTTPPPTTTTPPPTTTTPPPTTTTPPPTTTTPPPTTTTPPPTTEPPTTTTEPPRTTTEPPTVSPTTVAPSEDPTTTQPPGGTAFTGVQNVVPLGAIALILLTTGSGLMWAGSRLRRGKDDQD